MQQSLHRRFFLTGAGGLFFAPLVSEAKAKEHHFYVGTYKSGGGEGLQTLIYRPETDHWSIGLSQGDIINASFGAYNHKKKRHYILGEQNEGIIGVYRAKPKKGFIRNGQFSTHGTSPCYIALNTSQTHLVSANYWTGNIAVHKLDNKGLPIEPAIIRQNQGSGPNLQRQTKAHAHWAKFSLDEKFLYVVDLGTDEVLGYRFDKKTGQLGEKFTAFKCPPGFGPRHMYLHKGGVHAYLVGELTSEIAVLIKQDDGSFKEAQTLSTLPEGYVGDNIAAHIDTALDEKIIYVSNRGYNSICVFERGDDGLLSRKQIALTGGNWPRFFKVLKGLDRVLVAHQKSNDITIMRFDRAGYLSQTGQKIALTAPVFIGDL